MQAITVFGDHTFGTKAELKEREYSICRNSYNFAKIGVEKKFTRN